MNGIGNEDGGIRPEASFAGPLAARTENRRFVFDRDVDEVIRLFQRLFQKETNRELWEWKYRPPWTEETYAWVTTVGDRIIGHFGVVPLRGQIKGEETHFFQVGDVMADPEYRTWNFYQKVIPAEVAGDLSRKHPTAVVYGFTGEQLGLWYTWFTSLGRSTFVERADDCVLRFRPDEEPDGHGSRIDIREWPWDAPELDELWRQQRDNIRVGLVRDRTYLQWRYANHPLYEYSLFGVSHEGRPIGWLVTGRRDASDQGEDEMRIQDWLLPPEIRQPVFQRAASALRAKTLVLWMPARELPPDTESRKTGWQVMYHSLARDVSKSFLAGRAFYTLGEADEWWW